MIDDIDQELFEIIDDHKRAEDNPLQRSRTNRMWLIIWMLIIGFGVGIGFELMMYVIVKKNGY